MDMDKKKSVIRPWQVMRIYGHRGAVYCWVWCRFCEQFELELVYWRYVFQCCVDRVVHKILRLLRLGYWSGFCSQGRGRSWDRRSRYGEK